MGKCGGSFECRQRQVGDVIILDLEGQLTDDDAGAEFHGLIRRLARSGRSRLALNLAHLSLLDDPALCALLVDLVKVRQHGGDLELIDVQQPNMDLLVRTGTNAAFHIFPNERDAINKVPAAAVPSSA